LPVCSIWHSAEEKTQNYQRQAVEAMKETISTKEIVYRGMFLITNFAMVLMLASFLYCLLNPKEQVDGVIRTFNYISTGLIGIIWPLSVILSNLNGFHKGRRYERKQQKKEQPRPLLRPENRLQTKIISSLLSHNFQKKYKGAKYK
jgi:hypothetical protein